MQHASVATNRAKTSDSNSDGSQERFSGELTKLDTSGKDASKNADGDGATSSDRFQSLTAYASWRRAPAMVAVLNAAQPGSAPEPVTSQTNKSGGLPAENTSQPAAQAAAKEGAAPSGSTGLAGQEGATASNSPSPHPSVSSPVASAATPASQAAVESAVAKLPPVSAAKPEAGTVAVESGTQSVTEQPARQSAAERLEKFGSYTAYSLWRTIPAMAAGLISPSSESVFEEHGLTAYWNNQKEHWQGEVQKMSEEERAAAGVRLLDDPPAVEELPAQSAAVEALSAQSAAAQGAPAQPAALEALPTQPAAVPVPPSQPAAVQRAPAQPAAVEARPTQSAAIQAPPTQSAAEVALKATESGHNGSAPSSNVGPDAAVSEAGTSADSDPEAGSSMIMTADERLEQFGSLSAYSLWRTIPAQAAGLVTPRDESEFAEHGLTAYWNNQKEHWQGEVQAMSEEERIAAGVRLLDENPSEAPATASGSLQTPSQAPGAVGVDVNRTSTDDSAPIPNAAGSFVAEEVLEAIEKQDFSAADRLEQFGSYTAYSLWRTIPAMAAGLIQAEDEAVIAEHGLTAYWNNQKEYWQSKVSAMTEAERLLSGVNLLEG